MKPASHSPVYAVFYRSLSEIARNHGYALAVHGSLQTDIDLVAIPWTEECSSSDELLTSIRQYSCGVMEAMFGVESSINGPEPKPHGRIAYSLSMGNGAVIDLSIMQRIGK